MLACPRAVETFSRISSSSISSERRSVARNVQYVQLTQSSSARFRSRPPTSTSSSPSRDFVLNSYPAAPSRSREAKANKFKDIRAHKCNRTRSYAVVRIRKCCYLLAGGLIRHCGEGPPPLPHTYAISPAGSAYLPDCGSTNGAPALTPATSTCCRRSLALSLGDGALTTPVGRGREEERKGRLTAEWRVAHRSLVRGRQAEGVSSCLLSAQSHNR